MTTYATALIQTQHAPNAQTTVYTAPAGTRTIIDKFSGYGTLAGTLTVNLIPAAGGAAASNVLVAKTFTAGEAYTFPEIVGHILAPGDLVSVIASVAAAIVIRASGRTVT